MPHIFWRSTILLGNCKLYCKSSFIHPLSDIAVRITNSLAKHLYWFKKYSDAGFIVILYETPHKKCWWLKHGLTTSAMPASYRELFLWGVTLPCLIVCVKGKYVFFSILVEIYFLLARQMKCEILCVLFVSFFCLFLILRSIICGTKKLDKLKWMNSNYWFGFLFCGQIKFGTCEIITLPLLTYKIWKCLTVH